MMITAFKAPATLWIALALTTTCGTAFAPGAQAAGGVMAFVSGHALP